jgi:hypothetical protein
MRHKSWLCGIGSFRLHNLWQPLYEVRLWHAICKVRRTTKHITEVAIYFRGLENVTEQAADVPLSHYIPSGNW